jgi:hypothetical protein
MAKNAKIERSQKLFLKAMKAKFAEDPGAPTTKTAKEIKHITLDHVTLFPHNLHVSMIRGKKEAKELEHKIVEDFPEKKRIGL